MGKLEGKVALITGGARGQGRAHALRLAGEGAQVVVCDIAAQLDEVPYPLATTDDLDETVKLVEALDQRCIAVQADARDCKAMEAVAERAVAEFGRLDIVVVNHGIGTAGTWDLAEDAIAAILDVNIHGAMWAARAAIPRMIEQGDGGSIIFTASVAGIRAFAGMAPYVMSKHAVIGLTRALSADLAPYRIRVNAVCPGTTRTPMLANDTILSLFSGLPSDGTLETADFALRTLNLLPEPYLEAEDIANAVLWLASDDARSVTGIALPVDNGMANQPAGVPMVAAQALTALQAPRGD